ncbi:MAG: hypothetical protein LBR53_07975 [Deltaproteobacteria bacterium]|jgi:hypothetical protein|nr:hypothetical protein [Deltaproteobacteria bacterium]
MPKNTAPRRPDLAKLLKKIHRSYALALLGSWGLIVSRLNVFHSLPEELGREVWFYADLASLSLAIFGVLCALRHNSLLAPRLKRLSELGESGWHS